MIDERRARARTPAPPAELSEPPRPGGTLIQALVVAAIALPWLTLLPLHGAAAVAAHAIALVAAFHGAGLAIAALAGRRDTPPLVAVQWGIAALIAASGIAIACGVGTLAAHAVLVYGGVAIHTAALGIRFSRQVERVDAALAAPRAWLVPAALLAGLGALSVLGAAGDSFAQPFDDDGHQIAQLRRVLDTGALGDPIGYPRDAGLGGQVALAAVAAGAGDGFAHAIDALAAVLALGLALSWLRPRDAGGALWATVLVAAGYALGFAPFDPLPLWTAAGLIVCLYHLLSEADPPALPLAITAGALATVRHELAPIAAVCVIAAWWRSPRDHRRTVVLLAGVLAAVFPLVVARMVAWRSVPAAAHAVIAVASRGSPALRAVLAAAIAVPGALVLRLAIRDNRALRLAAAATAVALAAIIVHLTGAGRYSLRLALPIAIGYAIALAIELARSRSSSPAALIASLALCVVIHEGTAASGHVRWSRRMAAAATGIEVVERPPGDARDPYAAVLASAPAGATLAVWVAEPERLVYTRHRIFDLRTPAGARLRDHQWPVHVSRAAALLSALSADYLLIEADDARVRRTQADLFYRWLCKTPRPLCDDDLEAIAHAHRVVAERGGIQLIDLRR
jgi:hypothetical protein